MFGVRKSSTRASRQWGLKFLVVHKLLNTDERKDKEVDGRCHNIRYVYCLVLHGCCDMTAMHNRFQKKKKGQYRILQRTGRRR